MRERPDVTACSWGELSDDLRSLLRRRLEGLYGHVRDENAFDALAVDKQQALILFARRLRSLGLWQGVRRVENVYGVGGVGMSFRAWPLLARTLEQHRRFTALFAAHRDSLGGFYERRRSLAALHFLYSDVEQSGWSVHFDLYGPLSSPLSALRHLFHEKLRSRRPDWRDIGAVLEPFSVECMAVRIHRRDQKREAEKV